MTHKSEHECGVNGVFALDLYMGQTVDFTMKFTYSVKKNNAQLKWYIVNLDIVVQCIVLKKFIITAIFSFVRVCVCLFIVRCLV